MRGRGCGSAAAPAMCSAAAAGSRRRNARAAPIATRAMPPRAATSSASGSRSTSKVARRRRAEVRGAWALALSIAIATAAAEPPPAKPASGAFRDCPGCPEMVVVPAGDFLLGTSADEPEVDRERGESPPLPVAMTKAYAIGRYEVTVAQFRAFAEAAQYPLKGDCRITSGGAWVRLADRSWKNPGFGSAQADNEPVVCVSWDDAKAYTDWLTKTTGKVYRLPSETEWEYAARGGTTSPRYFGAFDSDEASVLSLACDYANVYDA